MADSYLKYENYKNQKVRLKKAISQEFYVEAIAIEYAIFEDRSESALTHAGLTAVNNKGESIGLSRKLNKLESNGVFAEKKVRNKMPIELIQEVKEWKKQRDSLIHALLKLQTDTDQFRRIAENGNDIMKRFDNKVSCLNRYFNKQKEK